MAKTYIGTSGFSYEDWRGVFYPEDISKSDMLSFYAKFFPAVEINSSFYAIPSPLTFEKMCKKTPDDFQFAVKVNKDLTHSEQAEPVLFEKFSRAIEPIASAGKLGCLLAQYPWSFRRSQANVDRLRQLQEELNRFPLVVEFRNASWAVAETFHFLKQIGIGYCCVDEPRMRGLMPMISVATSPIGYVRFHGRNAETWWHHQEAWQRYDYLYTADELKEWIPRVQALLSSTAKAFIFFNNHYLGKAAKNALLFGNMLGCIPVEGGLQNKEKSV